MIPYLLAAVGGYLIGQSFKDEDTYASGGRINSYEKVEGTDYELKIEVYYDKGGMNYFTGRPEERGYYLSVTPVQIERRPNGITTESYTAFSGIKALILRVGRQSPKAEKEAEMLAQERIPELKNYVLGKMKEKGIIAQEYAKGGEMARGGQLEVGDMVMVDDSGYVKYFDGFDLSEPALIISKDKKKVFGKVRYFYGLEMADGKKPFNNAEESMLTKVSKQGGKVKSKKWIQDALGGDEGSLRRTAKRKGLLKGDENLSMTDLKKLQKMGGKTAKRAHLAETLRKFDDGGMMDND